MHSAHLFYSVIIFLNLSCLSKIACFMLLQKILQLIFVIHRLKVRSKDTVMAYRTQILLPTV